MVGMLVEKRVCRAIELDKSLREAGVPMVAPLLMEIGRKGLGVGPERDIWNDPVWARVGRRWRGRPECVLTLQVWVNRCRRVSRRGGHSNSNGVAGLLSYIIAAYISLHPSLTVRLPPRTPKLLLLAMSKRFLKRLLLHAT